MKYFINIKSLEELKNTYRKLIFQLHPDKGGSTAEFQAMKNEYDIIFKKLQFASENKQEKTENCNTFTDIMDKLVNFNNLTINIIGSWVWIDKDNTYPIKEDLKAIGFVWTKARQKWYFNNGQKATGRYKKKDFETLKNEYGCKTYKTKKYNTITE